MGLFRSLPFLLVVSRIDPLPFDVGKSKRQLIASGLESLLVYNRAYTAGSPAPLIAWHLHAKQQQARAPWRVKLSAAVPKSSPCGALFIETSVYRAKSSSQKQIRPFPPRLLERRLTPPFRHFRVIPANQDLPHGPAPQLRRPRVMPILQQHSVAFLYTIILVDM